VTMISRFLSSMHFTEIQSVALGHGLGGGGYMI